MKKMYHKPEITDIQSDTDTQILESSFIPVNGTGSFDSREAAGWDDEMNKPIAPREIWE